MCVCVCVGGCAWRCVTRAFIIDDILVTMSSCSVVDCTTRTYAHTHVSRASSRPRPTYTHTHTPTSRRSRRPRPTHTQTHTREQGQQTSKDLIRTELRVEHNGESRTLHHFQYLTWPDHGVPDVRACVCVCVCVCVRVCVRACMALVWPIYAG